MNNSFFDFDLMALPKRDSPLYSMEGVGLSKVLVLAHFPIATKTEDYAFLENILKAVELAPLESKIHLISGEDQNLHVPLSNIARELKVEYVLVFGLNLSPLGIRAQLPSYKFINLNRLQIMKADTLATIRKERELKKNQKAAALWQSLKETFLS